MKCTILVAVIAATVLVPVIIFAARETPDEKDSAKWLRGVYRENKLKSTKLSDGEEKNIAYDKYWECLKNTSFLAAKKCIIGAVQDGEINLIIPSNERIDQLEAEAQKREAEQESARIAYLKAKSEQKPREQQQTYSTGKADTKLVEEVLSSWQNVGLFGVLAGRSKSQEERSAALQELQRRHPAWSWDAIMSGRVRTGMTELETVLSWGRPHRINHASYGDQWIYRRGNYNAQYLYFKHGILKSFNEN